MSHYIIWIVGVPIIIALVVLLVRRVRALNAAIAEHFEEEASGVKDPYAQMAAMANVEAAIDAELRRSRQAKRLLGRGKRPSNKQGG